MKINSNTRVIHKRILCPNTIVDNNNINLQSVMAILRTSNKNVLNIRTEKNLSHLGNTMLLMYFSLFFSVSHFHLRVDNVAFNDNYRVFLKKV